MSLVQIYTHSFFDDLLDGDGIVLDVGANVGNFAAAIVGRYPWRCISLEPSPEQFSQIPAHPRIEKHQLAVTGRGGEVVLNLTRNSECNSLGKVPGHAYTDSIMVRAVTPDEAFALAGADRVGLMKLDIEGSEIDLLNEADAELINRFDQITVEFHDGYDMTPPEVVRDVIRKICDAGFRVLYFQRGKPRHVDVLFVNRRRMGVLRWAFEIAQHWTPRLVRFGWRRLSGTKVEG